MDLTLTKRGDYVVRAALALARSFKSGGYRKIREVAADMDLPLHYTPQILNLLLKAGLAEARAGKQGGYRLLRSPDDVSLLELVEAGEGPLRTERCTLRGGPCHWENVCPVHSVWQEAYEALARVLGSRSLASLDATNRALELGEFDAPLDSHRRSRG
jgi:Rrf2 family transcriptional regulator, iron-sulfur cluster assembly transcription factor